MLRVLHVIPNLSRSAGGPPMVVERLAEKSGENGFDHHILTCFSGKSDNVLRRDASFLRRPYDALWGSGRRILFRTVAEADIVHLHTMWSPLVGAASLAARKLGVPTVLSPHGMLDPWSLSQKPLKKSAYLALFERRTISKANQVLFTTEVERENAAARFDLSATTVVSLGADSPPVAPEYLAALFTKNHPDLSQRTLILYLGRLHGKKRPEAVISAMPAIRTAIPNATLLIVGTGSGSAVSALKNQVSRLGLNDAVRFLGHLDGEEKWAAIAACRLFVLPSRQENFAIAAAESLRAGKPVILTPAVAIAREVEKAGAGLMVEEDRIEKNLADTITRLLLDPRTLESMEINAKAFANNSYNWDNSASSTHALYRQIIQGSPHPKPV